MYILVSFVGRWSMIDKVYSNAVTCQYVFGTDSPEPCDTEDISLSCFFILTSPYKKNVNRFAPFGGFSSQKH